MIHTYIMEDRANNLLGAAALALTDRMQATLSEITGLHETQCAAIVTIAQNPGLSIDELRKILGLTHSACVRLVDAICRRQFVQRKAGTTKRNLALYLTPTGHQIWQKLRRARAQVLREALAQFSPKESQAFIHLLEKILHHLTTSAAVGDHICRLCDEATCPQATCPVACASQRDLGASA